MGLLTLKNKLRISPTGDFIILGCGPSLNDFSEDLLRKISKGRTVIAIKQALFKHPTSDIHVLNTCNMSDYTDIYNSKDADENFHTVFQIAYPEMPFYDITKYDTILPIIFVNDFYNSLTVRKDLHTWTFGINPAKRCWGPGLIYETVFYLCQYLGAKNIYTIGWDLGKDNSGRDHFYDSDICKTKILNPAQPLEPEETKREVELSRLFYEWLKSKGCNLYISSQNSLAHKDIPRIVCV